MTDLVVDASIAMKWVLNEDGTDAAAALQHDHLFAPNLIVSECANVLWVHARRGVLTKAEAKVCLAEIETTPVTLVPIEDLIETALDLALELDHPIYDSLYLALAVRTGVTLVTADRRFVAAINGHGLYAQHARLL